MGEIMNNKRTTGNIVSQHECEWSEKQAFLSFFGLHFKSVSLYHHHHAQTKVRISLLSQSAGREESLNPLAKKIFLMVNFFTLMLFAQI